MGTLINILIRTSNRPRMFARCIESVLNQHYKNVRIIIAYDTFKAVEYITPYQNRGANVELLKVTPDKNHPYHWNLYCNELKDRVKDGWFFFLDDDDMLAGPHVLDNLANMLDDDERAYIVQFDRCGTIKPSNAYIEQVRIERGKIGMPCIILHHLMKKVGTFDGKKGADYRFIKEVAGLTTVQFRKLVLVRCDNRGLLGQME